MGSIRTCLLQEGTLYVVNKDMSVRRRDVIRVNRDLFLQEDTLYGVK
jgi:hypothetical protein